MKNTNTLLGTMTTLAMSILAISLFVAAPTGTLNILAAYADPEIKEKNYVPEGGGGGSTGFCFKEGDFQNCKDEGNVNKNARESCEEFFDTECKKMRK